MWLRQAIHKCPFCRKAYDYTPDDYHNKISCGNKVASALFSRIYSHLAHCRLLLSSMAVSFTVSASCPCNIWWHAHVPQHLCVTQGCTRTFGFMLYNVSEARMRELREELKASQERRLKKMEVLDSRVCLCASDYPTMPLSLSLSLSLTMSLSLSLSLSLCLSVSVSVPPCLSLVRMCL